MLDLVIKNERADLENTFGESMNEAFDQIKQLKDVEAQILTQLDDSVSNLLGDESLIKTLGESKNIAEYTAQKLRGMSQANQFIQRSREQYAPVAFRAAILYFVIQDLQKMNVMYKFSLTWFKELCTKSMTLTNQLREGTRVGAAGDANSEDSDEAGTILKNKFSIEDRVNLLSRTIT